MAVETIKKQKIKKKNRRINNAIVAVVVLSLATIVAHCCTVANDNPRYPFSLIISEGLSHIISDPLDINITTNQGLLVFASIIIPILGVSIARTNKMLRKHDVADSAHFMTILEYDNYQKRFTEPFKKKSNEGSNNVIHSADIFLSIDGHKTRRNLNILVIGGSGAGKSRFFVGPNTLQANCNYVFTDPSGELRNDYGKFLENLGYEVVTFDLTDVYRSSFYNPFNYIRTEKDVYVLANTIITNTTPPKGTPSDPIWVNGEKLLLEALILFLWHMAPPEQQNFNQVEKMLTMAQIDENDASAENPLDRLFKGLAEYDEQNLAYKNYTHFKSAAGKTAKSFIISLSARIQAFELPDIAYLTSKDTIHLDQFADSKKALFVVIPTAEDTFSYIVSLLYSQLFMETYNYCETRAKYGYMAVSGRTPIKVVQANNDSQSKQAKQEIKKFINECKTCTIKFSKKKKRYNIYNSANELVTWRGKEEDAKSVVKELKSLKLKQCGPKCPHHIRFMLDEFANLSQIPAFPQKVSTMRKYEISVSIILQTLSQLKAIYDKDWNSIVGNCDTKIFLGSDDEETIKWMVTKLGKKNTNLQTTSINAKGEVSISTNNTLADLMTYDQISQMPDTDCIVTVRGCSPYYGKKYEITNHPRYNDAMSTAGTFAIELSEEAKAFREAHSGRLIDKINQKRAAIQAEAQDAEKGGDAIPKDKSASDTPVNTQTANDEKPDSSPTTESSVSSEQTGFTTSRKETKKGLSEEEKNAKRKEMNRKRKEEAEKSQSKVDQDISKTKEWNGSPELDAEKAGDVFKSVGLSPDKKPSPQEVQEAAESVLIFLNPAPGTIKYGMTK